jgi:hypothetical protein
VSTCDVWTGTNNVVHGLYASVLWPCWWSCCTLKECSCYSHVSPCMQCCLTSRRTAACLPVSLSTHLLHLGLLMWWFAIYCGGFPPSFSFCPEKCLNAAGWWSSDGSRILSYLSPLLHNVLSSVMWSPTSLIILWEWIT